jgi:sodium/hydrogen exchanger-like protein 6/7
MSQMMHTIVLIILVLTVVLFGGTTSGMLELSGLRMGVGDDMGSSGDEDESLPLPTTSAWTPGNARG